MTPRFPVRALGALALLFFAFPALAQTPVGTWRTVDDATGEPKSIVRVFERDGQLFGEVVNLLPEGRRCNPCAGQFADRDMSGVQILSGFSRSGNEWAGGRITDPATARTYRAKMRVEPDGRLRVWGFVGADTPLTRRNQFWERVR